ncbi:hypothetical protein NPIL_176951, partial [Nephila pilipes]
MPHINLGLRPSNERGRDSKGCEAMFKQNVRHILNQDLDMTRK